MISFTADQRYIITGASSGIGQRIALQMNELGATVIAVGRSQSRLQELKATCAHPENMHLEIKDLIADINGLPGYIQSLRVKYGKFSGMVCSAGIGEVAPIRMVEFSRAKDIFDTNYFAPLFLTKGLVDRRNNIGKGTSIVVISSIDSFCSTRGQSVYAGSKAAIASSMKSISREVASAGIRINTVHPSMIKTPMLNQSGGEDIGVSEESQSNQYPFGWGTPSDVSNFVVFLLSDKSSYVSGQKYVIDSGGML